MLRPDGRGPGLPPRRVKGKEDEEFGVYLEITTEDYRSMSRTVP